MEKALLVLGDIDDAPFRKRLDEELSAFKKTNKEWSALTGIPEQTIINIRTVGRKGTLRAEYIGAFWKECPTLDINYIITGQRQSAENPYRDALTQINRISGDLL